MYVLDVGMFVNHAQMMSVGTTNYRPYGSRRTSWGRSIGRDLDNLTIVVGYTLRPLVWVKTRVLEAYPVHVFSGRVGPGRSPTPSN